MYLWNYISSELAENGQPSTSSIGYYDESNNAVIFTLNSNKWMAKLPEGINSREAMLLFMVTNVPILKDFIDESDKINLFNPLIEEMAPPVPEVVAPPQHEPIVQQYSEQTPVQQPEIELPVEEENEVKVVKCEKCGLFYDSAVYASCPFCAENNSPAIEDNPLPEQNREINNEAETIIDISNESNKDIGFEYTPVPEIKASVSFYINDGLYASVNVTDGEEISLGRADFCTIFCAEEKQLSRVHCTIKYNPENKTFIIRDKSLNGIFDFTGNRLPKDTEIVIPAGTRLWIATKAMMIELTVTETAPVVPEDIVNDNPYDDILITGHPEEQNICPVCGGEYTSDSIFCPWCGNKLTI